MNCLLFQRILAIVGLGVIIGAADSWIRPTTISRKATTAAPEVTSPAPAESSPKNPTAPAEIVAVVPVLGPMIDVAAAKKLFDEGVVFLDARITDEFRAGHVPQAFHLTSAMFNTPAAGEAMKALDPTQPIVIYCGGGDCDASKNLAILLEGAGYNRIHIFEAGFPAWEKAGHPVEKESK